MDIKKGFSIAAGMIIIVATDSCGLRGDDCADTMYNFEIGIKAYPDKEVLAIGDTLWLEVAAPTELKDKLTGQSVDFSGSKNLSSVVSFAKRDENEDFLIKAANKFNLLLVKGSYASSGDPDSFYEYRLTESGGFYRFKLGVVTKEKGIFRIAFSNATNVSKSKKPCIKASFEINFVDTEVHYNLFPHFGGDPTKPGAYCFRVE